MGNDVLKSLQRIHLIRSAYMSLLPDYALDLEADTIIVEPVSAEPLETLSLEFKRLRVQEGYYSGGAWNRDLDSWNGRKHAIMNELAGYVLDNRCSFQRLLTLMGEPDDLFQSDDARVANFTQAEGFPNPDFFAEYFWRGQHDYLAFTVHYNQVVHADWVYAEYEQGVV